MKIRIYTMTHKNFEAPRDPLYRPLHVGRAKSADLGYPGDDTGENISELNCYYSELTGLYWVWKNCHDVDYIGTCHYRRYLINEREQIFTEAEYAKLLSEYDLVTTKRVKLNNSYYDGFSANHNRAALDATGEVIRELYPEYHDLFVRLVNGTETYFGNMFVTSKTLYDAYCEWLFSIFAAVSERICLETGEDAYHKRVFGFISEFLLLVWVRKQKLRVKECKVGDARREGGDTRAEGTARRIFSAPRHCGGEGLFPEKERGTSGCDDGGVGCDGELRLCMQVIATAGMEREVYGRSILERENRFRELMEIFGTINRVVAGARSGEICREDIRFLKKNGVSELALAVAVQIPGGEKCGRERVLQEILRCMEADF